MRLLLFVALLAAVAGADEVILTSGGKLSGQVVEVTADHVKIQLANGFITLPRDKVVRIEKEKETDYLVREATARLKAGRPGEAVDLLERAKKEGARGAALTAELVRALRAQALELRKEKRLEEAQAAVRHWLDLMPGDPEARAFYRTLAEERDTLRELHREAERTLEGGDLERGLAMLDSWRLRRPPDDAASRHEMAQAHALAGQAALDEGRPEVALRHYRAAAAFGGDSAVDRALYLLAPIACLEAVRKGDLETARKALDGFSSTYPDAAVPAYLQAVIDNASGDVNRAVRGYREAARLAEANPPSSEALSYASVRSYAQAVLQAALAKSPREAAARWRTIFLDSLTRCETDSFVVYAPTKAIAHDVGEAADKAYAAAANDLLGGMPSADKAQLVVHPDRQAYLSADPAPEGSPLRSLGCDRAETAGVTYDTRNGHGKEIIRIETYVGDPGLLSDTIPHEVVHVVQRQGFAAYRKAGLWLEEGLATLYESKAGQARRHLRLLHASSIIPLRELLALGSLPAGEAGLFYDESNAFLHYLEHSSSPTDFQKFLRELSRKPLVTALDDVYHAGTLDDLERAFRASLK